MIIRVSEIIYSSGNVQKAMISFNKHLKTHEIDMIDVTSKLLQDFTGIV